MVYLLCCTGTLPSLYLLYRLHKLHGTEPRTFLSLVSQKLFRSIYSLQKLSLQYISTLIYISFRIRQGYRDLLYPHLLTAEDIHVQYILVTGYVSGSSKDIGLCFTKYPCIYRSLDMFQDPARISGSALPTSTHSRRQSSPTYSPQQSRSYSFYKIQSFRLIKNKKSEISGVRFASACLLSKCVAQFT